LRREISNIQSSEIYTAIAEIKDMNAYFANLKQSMQQEIDALQKKIIGDLAAKGFALR
jgi:hypothetical protein